MTENHLYLTKNLAKDKAFSHGNVKIYLFRKHQACLAICSEVFPEVLFLSRIQEIFYMYIVHPLTDGIFETGAYQKVIHPGGCSSFGIRTVTKLKNKTK